MSNGEINTHYYTRSQARAKSQAMDDGIVLEDSVSQVNSTRRTNSHASSTCRSTHSTSSHRSGRSREQLDLDISALTIKMNSQEKRAQLERRKLEIGAQLERRKLDIDLDIEHNELQEQMDLAKNETEIRYDDRNQDRECSSSSHVDITNVAARAPEQEQRLRNPSNADINKMLEECSGYELPDRTSDKALEALYRQQTIMMGALQAPKIELMEFHGDPVLYHSFIRSFEENVEKMLSDDGALLAHLIHLCKGEAGRAIRCCNLMDPKQGYARARRLLKQRFGDKHTITELWIKKLNEGGPRVNLQEYADELLDCYESLNALGALQEMDAQRNLLAMIMKLPMHLQNKWQDYVFDLKSREDRRSTLKDVVKFVDRAAAVVSDPVYGSARMKSKQSEKTTISVAYVATADVRCPICDDREHSVP